MIPDDDGGGNDDDDGDDGGDGTDDVDVLDEDDKPLVSVAPSDSLLDAIFNLSYGKVHRLLVVNPTTGNALHVLTYRHILQFIHICVCYQFYCFVTVM